MLLHEKLVSLDTGVKTAVEKLFEKAFRKQSHENDLFLILIHGHYREDLVDNPRLKRMSPYVFGAGSEGLTHSSQYEFYNWFRNARLIDGNEQEVKAQFKTLPGWRLEQSINTQLELMVYLKFWESDMVLKQFVNLCRLIHGEPYDWHLKLGHSRKNIIEYEIKEKSKVSVPKFHKLISDTYIRQIRNAAAHSQFRIAGDNLNLFNYDPAEGFNLKNITIEEWEDIFHKTILLYNALFGCLSHYNKYYREQAVDKHFGHCLRITTPNGENRQWLKLRDDVESPWMWYQNWAKSYIKRIYIIRT